MLLQLEKIKKEKHDGEIFHALCYFSIPRSCGDWEIWEGSYGILKNSSLNGNIIIQIGFNAAEDNDKISFSLLYGREHIKNKASEDSEENINKDFLTEF